MDRRSPTAWQIGDGDPERAGRGETQQMSLLLADAQGVLDVLRQAGQHLGPGRAREQHQGVAGSERPNPDALRLCCRGYMACADQHYVEPVWPQRYAGLNGLQLEPSVDGSFLAFAVHEFSTRNRGFCAIEEAIWRAGDDARPLI